MNCKNTNFYQCGKVVLLATIEWYVVGDETMLGHASGGQTELQSYQGETHRYLARNEQWLMFDKR